MEKKSSMPEIRFNDKGISDTQDWSDNMHHGYMYRGRIYPLAQALKGIYWHYDYTPLLLVEATENEVIQEDSSLMHHEMNKSIFGPVTDKVWWAEYRDIDRKSGKERLSLGVEVFAGFRSKPCTSCNMYGNLPESKILDFVQEFNGVKFPWTKARRKAPCAAKACTSEIMKPQEVANTIGVLKTIPRDMGITFSKISSEAKNGNKPYCLDDNTLRLGIGICPHELPNVSTEETDIKETLRKMLYGSFATHWKRTVADVDGDVLIFRHNYNSNTGKVSQLLCNDVGGAKDLAKGASITIRDAHLTDGRDIVLLAYERDTSTAQDFTPSEVNDIFVDAMIATYTHVVSAKSQKLYTSFLEQYELAMSNLRI